MEPGETPRNPFVHIFHMNTFQKVKMIFLGMTLLPIRLLFALICLTLTTSLAYAGLYNLSTEDIDRRPFTHWRLYIRKAICMILRFMFFVCGFHRVKIIGKQAGPNQARILAVAPHSTFFDALAVVVMGAPSVVAKAETNSIPFWGSLIKLTQPVLVHRNDPNSRQNTIRHIVERSNPEQEWQQVLIFPEGTCTNRSCFIAFRPGAFLPGVAVQPVLIRYDNDLDTVTWTWEGLPAWKVIVYSLSQLNINCSIEFLEPYIPSSEEIKDSKLYAENVRSVMAKKLDIPTTNCNYFDYLRIEKSQRRGKALQKLQRKLEESLIQTTSYMDTLEEPSVQSQEERDGFPARIGCSNDLPELSAVLEELEGKDLRHIRLSILISASQDSLSTFLDQAFILFDKDLGNNHISEDSFLQLLSTHLFLSNKECKETAESLCKDAIVSKPDFLTFISETKPNHLKVVRGMENQLTKGVTDLLTKSASLTAERMAARLEKVAASGSNLVSDMSATVAAGRDKVTDVLSSAVTSLHKRTGSNVEKKTD